MECPICCEKVRHQIECPKCQKLACQKCYMAYFISILEPAKCIYECGNNFNIKFLTDNFTKKFIWGNDEKSYKVHREHILFDQQLSLMPLTQIEIEKDMKIEEYENKIKIIKTELYNLITSLPFELYLGHIDPSNKHIQHGRIMSHLREELWEKELNNENIEKLKNIENININYIILYNELKRFQKNPKNKEIEKEEIEKEEINRGPCPNCPGYIKDKWTCSLCKTKICHLCKEILNSPVSVQISTISPTSTSLPPMSTSLLSTASISSISSTSSTSSTSIEIISEFQKSDNNEHKCDENILLNIKHLSENNYKKCPKCKIFIEKSQGCNQMFCTKCLCFFDWHSGKEIQKTAFLHNPHYFEWLQSNQQVNCNENDITFIMRKLNTEIKNQSTLIQSEIRSILLESNELLDTILSPETRQRKFEEKLLEIRKKYLRKIYSKKEFQRYLHQINKKFSYENEIDEIKTMFSNSIKSITYKINSPITFDNNIQIKNYKQFIHDYFNKKKTIILEPFILDYLIQILSISNYTYSVINEVRDRYNGLQYPDLFRYNNSFLKAYYTSFQIDSKK